MSKKKVSGSSLENLKLGRLPAGEAALSSKTVTVRLPCELDEYVRSQPNRNQWLTKVIREAIQRESQQN